MERKDDKPLFARKPDKEGVYLVYGYLPAPVLRAWIVFGVFPPRSDRYQIVKEKKEHVPLRFVE